MYEVYIKIGLGHQYWQRERNLLLNWCVENCTDFHTFDMLHLNSRWSFVNEEDAMAFKLRWY